jgi:hypothetical protein
MLEISVNVLGNLSPTFSGILGIQQTSFRLRNDRKNAAIREPEEQASQKLIPKNTIVAKTRVETPDQRKGVENRARIIPLNIMGLSRRIS